MMTSGGDNFHDFSENDNGTSSPGGVATTLGSGTPDTGGGRQFLPVAAEFNH